MRWVSIAIWSITYWVGRKLLNLLPRDLFRGIFKLNLMKIQTQFLIFSLFILINSCKQNPYQEFKSFPERYNLKGTKIINKLYLKFGAIDIHDSLVIISSPLETENCIHFLDKNSFNHILSTGKVGRGPNEISNPGLGCIDAPNGIFWYRDIGKKKIWQFKIDEVLKSPDFMPSESIPLPKDQFFIQFLSDKRSLFSFSNPNQDVLISYFDQHGKLVDSLDIPNKLDVYKKLSETTRMYTATYLYETHPQKELHVIAFRMADIICIVNRDGEVISRLKGPGDIIETPDYHNNNYNETNQQIVVSDQNIYCLYSGKLKLEMKDGEMAPNYAKKINVYNWLGSPLAEIELEYTAISFDIDFDNNRLITFSPETGGIVYYNLPTFNKIQ